MKHFFIVHSNITWLITQQLIKRKQLTDYECVLLIDRRLQINSGQIRKINISDLSLHDFRLREAAQVVKHYNENRETLHQIDAAVAAVCPAKELYELYLPHNKRFKYCAFQSHSQCKRFYYIEEGNLSYAGNSFDKPRPFIKHLILSVFYKFYLQDRVPPFPNSFSIEHPKYAGAFGLSELAFPGFPSKNILPLPFTERPELKQIRQVWVFGPYVEFGEMPQEVRLRLSREFLEYLIKKGVNEIHIKFHPTQYLHPDLMSELRKTLHHYQDQITLHEIPQSVSLEDIAYSSRADFYLITSSAAIYAIACGCRVFSFAYRAVEYHPSFQKTLDAVPENIRQKIEFIEL